MNRLLTIFLFSILVFACKSRKEIPPIETVVVPADTIPVLIPPVPPSSPEPFLTYTRTPCFGMCPVFELTVYADGKAVYEGRNFTDMIGKYRSEWDTAVLQRISEVADSIGYFSLEDKYDFDKVTDLPTTTTTILKNGTGKTVANRYKGPRSLLALYLEIDRAIELSSWQPAAKDDK